MRGECDQVDANSQLLDTMRRSLGMLIPVWFPESLSDDEVRLNLRATLHDCDHFVPWEHIVLVVDGDARSYGLVQELQGACQRRYGRAFEIVYEGENRGKGSAVRLGTQWFLAQPGLEYLTIRDADGDHVLNDLLNLMRLALDLRNREGTNRLIVVGRRTHPHRSVGWLRGELEILLNRVLVEAVRFALAQRQQVLNTRYFSLSDEYPDLHSGYKVYSRPVCQQFMASAWERPPWVGAEIYRYGVEAVPFVEGVMAGAVVGEVTRVASEPHFSGHGGFALPETNGAVLLWTFLRLGLKADRALALLDNQLPRLMLWTEPRERQTLIMLRQYVLQSQLDRAM